MEGIKHIGSSRWPACSRMLVIFALALSSSLLTPLLARGQELPARSAAAGGSSGVQATLTQCLTATDQADRAATFSGQMASIPTTQRMAIRVEVQERLIGEAAFKTISAPGLGIWRVSDSGVKIYKYLRQVTNLPAPGDFRAFVGFRWLGAKGRVIHQTARHTQICEQPDERPKLTIGQVTATQLGSSQKAEYQIAVHNEGRSAVSPFGVLVSINGTPQPVFEAPSIEGASSTILDVVGPICEIPGAVTVTLDPQHQIEEAPGGGQPVSLPCPLAGS